ncbi:MAG: histidine phosphatase family protein [Patescibacteria group bacterium]
MTVKITYFVHGTTTDNEKDLASGWADPKLSPLGINQAKELGKLVAAKKFAAVFCSDLQRAIDSANLAFGQNYTVMVDKRLREINYGDWNQKPHDFKNNLTDYINKPFANGESYLAVQNRIADFLKFLNTKYFGQNVAIVAHQAPQLALEVLLNKKTWEQAIATGWRNKNAWQPGWKYILE